MTYRLGLFVLLVSLVFSSNLSAADREGSSDHPLIGRYDGSEIVGYTQKAFDEYGLILGPSVYQGGSTQWNDQIDLEGTVTRILYRAPQERSALEIYRNYIELLQQTDFTELFSCKQDACGPAFYQFARTPWEDGFGWVRDIFGTDLPKQRYWAAKLTREEGDVYVALYVVEHNFLNSLAGPYVHLDVVELAPIETNMVVVKADALDRDIQALGHASVYGINFDTDKAVIKPESKAALDEVGKLLSERLDLSLHVVGHTDNEGSFDYNLNLSGKRAAAVVDALVADYGIDRSRLDSNGVGFLAPVASNRTEEGRAQNRRVELVERISGP